MLHSQANSATWIQPPEYSLYQPYFLSSFFIPYQPELLLFIPHLFFHTYHLPIKSLSATHHTLHDLNIFVNFCKKSTNHDTYQYMVFPFLQ